MSERDKSKKMSDTDSARSAITSKKSSSAFTKK